MHRCVSTLGYPDERRQERQDGNDGCPKVEKLLVQAGAFPPARPPARPNNRKRSREQKVRPFPAASRASASQSRSQKPATWLVRGRGGLREVNRKDAIDLAAFCLRLPLSTTGGRRACMRRLAKTGEDARSWIPLLLLLAGRTMPRHAHTHSPITAGSWFGDTGRPFLDVPVAFPVLLEPFGNTERTTFGLCL